MDGIVQMHMCYPMLQVVDSRIYRDEMNYCIIHFTFIDKLLKRYFKHISNFKRGELNLNSSPS